MSAIDPCPPSALHDAADRVPAGSGTPLAVDAPARDEEVGAATPPAQAKAGDPGSPTERASPHRPYAAWRPATLIKKARVRDAAAKLLARATIHSVTPEDVSRAAGLTKSSCYYYYGTRDALLADTLTEHLVALDAAVCAAYDATSRAEPVVRMTALAHAFLRVALAQRDAHLALRLNAKLVSDRRRQSVTARSRQVMATLRTALEECVPGLEASPAMAELLMRQFVGGLSEAVTWFKPDARMNRRGMARLIACQTLMTARAVVGEAWVLPPPAPPDPADHGDCGSAVAAGDGRFAAAGDPLPDAAGTTAAGVDPTARPTRFEAKDAGATGNDDDGRVGEGSGEGSETPLNPTLNAIWLTPEQARRSLPKLVRAAGAGTEVVLTLRGVPTAKLVPATRERQRMQGIVGGRTRQTI